MKNVKSCSWVAENLNKVSVFDAGIVKPGMAGPYKPCAVVRGAGRFDISDALSDPKTQLSNMMCNAKQFQSHMRQLGVNQNDTVVLYDDSGLFSAARGWWMLKNMGFEHVFIMDGGLPEWLLHGFPVQQQHSTPNSMGNFTVIQGADGWQFIERYEVLRAILDESSLLLDARSPLRFSGCEQEPRTGMRSGHIPNSKNLYYNVLLTERGLLRSIGELQALFRLLGCEGKALQFSCGSGVTACILALAADECGYTKLGVYDGSWNEWGSMQFCNELPIRCESGSNLK
ncbi:sulfurtransferase [Pseudoalteromonas sp. MMG005]|uniref:sulfurtransferase n=1 Tax=Pseudoalteromonas sp. MMG005 TaxID=2822682 RepID=UPI001B3A7398|nr:sulfurtransferase [Pseudoalteromonas sp. MMG005]MBQ4846465.1 sulfurtransferase [Pseudoalteromonas sp. MMG005]